MNEKGLVANLLFLTESSYYRPDDNRPVMGISIWTQYVLDNFATVEEAVAGLKDDTFRIDAPDLPYLTLQEIVRSLNIYRDD